MGIVMNASIVRFMGITFDYANRIVETPTGMMKTFGYIAMHEQGLYTWVQLLNPERQR